MQPNLIDRIGLYAEKDGAEQILAGTFEFPEDGDPYRKEMVEEMRMEDRVREAGPLPTGISRTEHNNGWKKQKERTASVTAGLSFSDHKAAIEDEDMAEIDRLLREILIAKDSLPTSTRSSLTLRSSKSPAFMMSKRCELFNYPLLSLI